MTQKYEVRVGKDEWMKTSKATDLGNGWLNYETKEPDGHGDYSVTRGLAKPGNWRKVEPRITKRKH